MLFALRIGEIHLYEITDAITGVVIGCIFAHAILLLITLMCKHKVPDHLKNIQFCLLKVVLIGATGFILAMCKGEDPSFHIVIGFSGTMVCWGRQSMIAQWAMRLLIGSDSSKWPSVITKTLEAEGRLVPVDDSVKNRERSSGIEVPEITKFGGRNNWN